MKRNIIFSTLFSLALIFLCLTVSAQSCGTSVSYCESGNSTAADLSWDAFSQDDLDGIYPGYTLYPPVSYVITGSFDETVGNDVTTYHRGSLGENTSYSWEITAHYNYDEWSDSAVTETFSFTTPTCDACSTDEDCDDGDPTTVDTCEPGGYCTYIVETCSTDEDCDDGDPRTIDTCEPGGYCTHVVEECDTDEDCDDGDPTTVDTCEPGGYCTHEVQPCSTDEDCDDGDPTTVDTCEPGGYCTHEVQECDTNEDCDDGDPTTVDICEPGGYCTHEVQECDDVGDCDDGDPTTIDVCEPGGYCTHTPSQPPTSPEPPSTGPGSGDGNGNGDSVGEEWDHCLFAGKSIPTFYWTYDDPDDDPVGTDPQTAYQIRIDDNSGFPSGDPDPGEFTELVAGSGTSYNPSHRAEEWAEWMDWNTNYWWIVRVKDSYGQWSDWSDSNKFKTPLHTYPSPSFTWFPLEPNQEEVVVFIPAETGLYYFWTVTEGEAVYTDETGPTNEQPHIIFQSTNNKIKLKITDADVYYCESDEMEITAQLPLPEYQEVAPIIWLQKMFAAITGFFNGFFQLANNY